MAREVMCSFENGLLAADAIESAGGGTLPAYSTTATWLHRDSRGLGGVRSLWLGDRPMRCTNTTSTPLHEGFIRFCVWIEGSPDGGTTTVIGGLRIYSGTNEQLVIVPTFYGSLKLYLGTLLVAESANGVYPQSRYCLIEVHYRASSVDGFVRVYVDDPGSYTNPVVTLAGNTQNSGGDRFDSIGFNVGIGTNLYADDCGINSITLAYTPTSGGFLAGDTIVGSTSGAEARVTTAIGGRLWLSHWNNVAFLDGEVITGTPSTATGTVTAPFASYVNGFEPNSSFLANGFQRRLTPTGQGANTQLTNSAAAPTANNWTYVDEVPVNATDYVIGAAALEYDLYVISDLPSSAQVVKAVQTFAYALAPGVGFSPLRVGGTTYFGPNYTLAGGYTAHFTVWNQDPSTGDWFPVATVNNAQTGFGVTV